MTTSDMSAPTARPPTLQIGALAWARTNLFNNWFNTALTLAEFYLIIRTGLSFFEWGIVNSLWNATALQCQALAGKGACWAVIQEKHRFILFGRYPYEEQWRPLLAVVWFVGLVGASSFKALWTRWLGVAWAVGLVGMGVLMWGGVLGLELVPVLNWGGLPLTLILSVVGMVFAFPLAVLLALGRRSHLPIIKALSVVYIEFVRGVPLITVLFMATVMFPLFLPTGVTIDKLLRAQIGIILFAAAYLAEVIRGGLQAIPKGQSEAADALGLGYWQKTMLIILPQALRIVIPPLVNTFIGTFKDTSLVIIIGLFDLLNAAKTAVGDPPWRTFYVETYLFIAVIYFAFCFFMSKYSQNLESDLHKGTRR
jgi:general L-amino acid transport system permease protein